MRRYSFFVLARLAAALPWFAAAAIAASPPRSATAPAAHPVPAAAKPVANPALVPAPSLLDTTKVHKLYMESEFDEAIASLEGDLKGKRFLGHQDSVFIYKYLGVMYTSKYETRELGKRYMYQLLVMEPTARISDMFASDMIYMIFKNVQDEYFATHPHDVPQLPPPHKDPDSSSSHAAWYWAGGVGLAVVVGVAAYVFIFEPSKKRVSHPIGPP
jgi:hypothetical protein